MTTSPLARAFFGYATAQPGKAALLYEAERVSYGELAQGVRLLAAGLAANGVRHGDHVGVALYNSSDFITLMLAAAQLGLVLAPVSPGLPDAAMRTAFAATGVRHVVAEQNVLHRLMQQGAMPDGLRLVAGGGSAAVGHLRGLGTATQPAPESAWGRAEDPFILTTTSGSTGAPKPIMLRQQTKLLRAQEAISLYGVTAEDITLAATPLYHSLALRLAFMPLICGGTCALLARFSPLHWIATVQRDGVTFTIAVADQLRSICATPPGLRGLASLRCVVASSSPLDAATRTALLAQAACECHECYGTSEIAIAASIRLDTGVAVNAAVGRPAPGVDIRIIDAAGQAAPDGDVGEITCRTKLLFGGYHAQPEATEAAMLDEHFRTGDLGWLDSDGRLHFAGRKNDIIRTGGMNVFPADVEAAFTAYPGIKEAAAFAAPDARLGEIVGLAYVPDGSNRIDHRHLQLHCAHTLADFQQPRMIVAMASLPRNSMGKLQRRRLAGAATARAKTAVLF